MCFIFVLIIFFIIHFTLYCRTKFFQVPEAVPYKIPQLHNLKDLDMTVAVEDDDCLLSCAAFLKACPSLYKFVLKVEFFFFFVYCDVM